MCASHICLLTGQEVSVRLAGGNDTAGRVEVFIDGEWGTVCDDLWNLDDAEVACRQLGFPSAISALSFAYFGEGEGSILMDNVECEGNETSLIECKYDADASDCSHSEDAGVVCAPAPGNDTPVHINCFLVSLGLFGYLLVQFMLLQARVELLILGIIVIRVCLIQSNTQTI